MLLDIITIILLYLLFSITAILTIVSFIEPVDSKKVSNEVLFLGIFIAIIAQIALVYFASLVFVFGDIIYIITGLFLVYLGVKGVLKHEKKFYKRILFTHRHVGHLILKIAVVDIMLSLDTIVAVVGVTRNINYIVTAMLISIFILFLLIVSIRDYFHHIQGLAMAASFSMLFLGSKLILSPFNIIFSNIITALIVSIICTMVIFYSNKGHFDYVWRVFMKNYRQNRPIRI